MNKQYRGSRLPYTFSKLSNETKYNCGGSTCTCKYFNDRTQYDATQYNYYNKINNDNYDQNMFKNFKNKK